jgi:hypothetical protein
MVVTAPGDSEEPLRALCLDADAVFDALADAFAARAVSLARDHANPDRLPDSIEWYASWLRHLLATLRLGLDDPAIVRALADAAAFGRHAGLGPRDHAMGMHALAWACRDVFPARTSPSVMAAIEARAGVLARVSMRASAVDTTDSASAS